MCGKLMQPGIGRGEIGAESLVSTIGRAIENRPIASQFAGLRRIEEMAGIITTHLKTDTEFEFSVELAAEAAIEAVECIGPDNGVDADAGTPFQDFSQLL